MLLWYLAQSDQTVSSRIHAMGMMVMWLLGFLGSLGHDGDDDDILATRVSCVCVVYMSTYYTLLD